jgi:hypothetical protein
LVEETVELMIGYAAEGARVSMMALITLEASSVATALLASTTVAGTVTFATAEVTGLAGVETDPAPHDATAPPGAV